MNKLENDWGLLLKDEFLKSYYVNLELFLNEERENFNIFPEKEDVFKALRLTSYKNTRVVILGQDPYHRPGLAHGLAFSVKKGMKIPPSLQNIYKELHKDLGITPPAHGDLTEWALRGVLLLNTIFTVREGMPNSHKSKGWECFTDKIIEVLNQKDSPIVFILWGANAGTKRRLITNPKHIILTAVHPSPLSAYNGFFGCCHFSMTNKFLLKNNLKEIDWSIV